MVKCVGATIIGKIESSQLSAAPQITCVNTMAAGLKYCDRALTVSPSYAVECCTDPEKGDLVKIG